MEVKILKEYECVFWWICFWFLEEDIDEDEDVHVIDEFIYFIKKYFI